MEVRDNGHGIEEKIIEHIFEPFFTTKEAGEGAGLGLFMVHHLVTRNNAHIEVTSVPDKRTSFRVYIPV